MMLFDDAFCFLLSCCTGANVIKNAFVLFGLPQSSDQSSHCRQALYEDRRVGGELALKSGFLFTPNEAGLRRSNASLTTTAGAQPAGMPVEDPYSGCYPWNHPFPHWSNYVSHVPPYAEAARGHEISLLETNASRLDCHPSSLHPGRPYAA
jgi:hypothetical protein